MKSILTISLVALCAFLAQAQVYYYSSSSSNYSYSQQYISSRSSSTSQNLSVDNAVNQTFNYLGGANVRTINSNKDVISELTTYQEIIKKENGMSGTIQMKVSMKVPDDGFSATLTLPLPGGAGIEFNKNFSTQEGSGEVVVELDFTQKGLQNTLKPMHVYINDSMLSAYNNTQSDYRVSVEFLEKIKD